jgi:hypothetical protein
MRLMHRHHLAGAGRVIVQAPENRVFIHVDPDAEYRSVDVLADRGQAAWAGPVGIVALGVEVGRPGFLSMLKGMLGLREGSSVSGGGSVVSASRGGIVSGGSITHCATGDGATVTVNGVKREPLEPGVHLTVPLYCSFRIKAHDGVEVRHGDQVCSLEYAQAQGWLEVVK